MSRIGGGRLSLARVAVVILLVSLCGGVCAYYYFFKGVNYSVRFAERNTDIGPLQKDAPVIFSGVEIGQVVEILPETSSVLVKIEVEKKYNHLLTTASNFYIGELRQKPVVLVKNIGSGRPLRKGEIVPGVNSFIEWKTLEYKYKLDHAEYWNEVKQWAGDMKDRLNRFIGSVDWDKLGEQTQKKFEELSDELDAFFEDPEVQKNILEIDRKMNEIKDALSRAGDSEEARQLQQALDKAYQRLKEELKRASASSK